MKPLGTFLKRETAWPVLTLTFSSVVSVALIAVRIVASGNLRYGYLAWNLFLAWLPLIFSVFASDLHRRDGRGDWRFFALAGAWLLFFPNAPYIFTDVIHLRTPYFPQFWVDLTLILLCAMTGLVLGFVSLYLMQSVVTRMAGRAASWLFIALVAGLSGFGIYLGRFLRFNSWDVLLRPGKVAHGLGAWAADPLANPATGVAFPILFATFLFIAYVMLYALTHLPRTGANGDWTPVREG